MSADPVAPELAGTGLTSGQNCLAVSAMYQSAMSSCRAVPLGPAPVLDQGRQDHSPASMLDRSQRVEIVLSAGRRIIAEGSVDIDVMLKLARGLEALG